MRIIQDRDEMTRSIYETLYEFDFGRDLSPFDLILNTDRFDPEEVYDIVSKVIDLYIKKLHKGG